MLLRLNWRGATSSIQNNSVVLRDFQDYPGFTVWEMAKKSLVKCRIVDFFNFDTLPQPLHVPDKHRRRFRTVYTRVLRRVLDRWYTAQSPALLRQTLFKTHFYGAVKGTYRHVRHAVNHVTASELLLKHFPGTGGVDRDRMTRHSKPKTSITDHVRPSHENAKLPCSGGVSTLMYLPTRGPTEGCWMLLRSGPAWQKPYPSITSEAFSRLESSPRELMIEPRHILDCNDSHETHASA